MSTQEFLTKRLFEPLKMKDTKYKIPKANQSRLVLVCEQNDHGVLTTCLNQAIADGKTVWSGTSGLFSTASDYMNFCEMLLYNGKWHGERILGRKTVEMMTVNHVGSLFNGPGMGFGLGFAVVENVAESGLPGSLGLYYWAGAYNTHFFIDPKENMVAIFMTQTRPLNSYYHEKMRQLIYQSIID